MASKIAPPVRFGVLSFAMYHANFWSRAVADSELATLVGIWDDSAGRGEAAAKEYGTAYWADLDALLGACDAVAITSETLNHVELAERAAARGCHILVEKPLATTMEGCDRIQAAVERAGVSFMQSFPKRFDPVNHELKRLVDEGELGRITLMRVRHGHLYGLMSGGAHSGWPQDPVLSGGGSLLDEGVHGADFIRWMLGEPDAVMATIAYPMGHRVEDLGLAIFTYDNGPVCELASSNTFAAGDNSVEIFGTGGTAVLTGVDLASRDVTEGGVPEGLSPHRGELAGRHDPALDGVGHRPSIQDHAPVSSAEPAAIPRRPDEGSRAAQHDGRRAAFAADDPVRIRVGENRSDRPDTREYPVGGVALPIWERWPLIRDSARVPGVNRP